VVTTWESSDSGQRRSANWTLWRHPWRVYSRDPYLQRLGRTGRRPETTRNLLFLSTDLAELWLASALTLLWSRGYVEDVVAPVLPRHIVAQQILGLVLQERRLVTHELAAWLGGLVAVDGADEVLDHLVRTEFVVDEGGLISIGPRAEQEWGRRYFADLTSAFTSEPMLEVVLGRRVLGYLPPLSLAARPGPGGLVVLLAGRAWDVLDIDWRRKRVLVAASEMKGRSRWNSGGPTMNFALARAHHDVVAGGDPPAVALSQRATGKLAELRAAHAFAAPGSAEQTTWSRTPPAARCGGRSPGSAPTRLCSTGCRACRCGLHGWRTAGAVAQGGRARRAAPGPQPTPRRVADDQARCRRPRTRVAEVLRRGTGAVGPRDSGRADGRPAGRPARRRSTGECRQRL
jgi:hypothetical protein